MKSKCHLIKYTSTNMSRIFIKGEKEPIKVEHARAVKIKEFFDDVKIANSEKIEIEDWSGTKGEIKSIWLDPYKGSATSTKQVDYIALNRKERANFLSLSLDEKSKRLGFFGMVYMQFTGSLASEEVKQKAIAFQRDFFEKNPRRRFPNVDIFKSLLPAHITSKGMLGGVISVALQQDLRDLKYDS